MGLFDTLLDAVATSPAANQYRDIKMHNGLLPYIFSKSDSLKRSVKDAVSSPVDYLAKSAGTITDDPERFAGMMSGMAPGGVGMAGITSRVPNNSKIRAIAEGYWHPIGDGKKLQVPIAEMSATRVNMPVQTPRSILNPETMQGGVIIPATGDRSIAGQMLTGVNGVTLQNPVALEGGPDFMRTHAGTGQAWASNFGAAQKIANKIREASKVSNDVYMPYVAMGHGSMDFNTMMSDALLEQMRAGKISKKAISAFDDAVRAQRPEWLGVNHAGARAQLDATGELRHAFVDRMGLDEFQGKGFPDIASTRFALTEPSLLDAPFNSAGYSVAKVDPNGIVTRNPAVPHSTYDSQIAGQYAGGLLRSVPRDVMFPEWYNARRAAGLPESADHRSFDLVKPIQKADQQWLDGIMSYLERGPASP